MCAEEPKANFDRFHWPCLHAFRMSSHPTALHLKGLGCIAAWAWLWAVTHLAPALLPVVTARAKPSHAPLGELQAD